jgi:hypothetical protein
MSTQPYPSPLIPQLPHQLLQDKRHLNGCIDIKYQNQPHHKKRLISLLVSIVKVARDHEVPPEPLGCEGWGAVRAVRPPLHQGYDTVNSSPYNIFFCTSQQHSFQATAYRPRPYNWTKCCQRSAYGIRELEPDIIFRIGRTKTREVSCVEGYENA